MICPNCGAEVKDGAAFCPKCGSRMNTGQPDQQAQGPADSQSVQQEQFYQQNQPDQQGQPWQQSQSNQQSQSFQQGQPWQPNQTYQPFQQYRPGAKKTVEPLMGLISAVASLLALVGCFAPWVTVFGISFNGMPNEYGGGGDGILILILAIVSIIMGILPTVAKKNNLVLYIVGAIVSVIALIIIIYEMAGISGYGFSPQAGMIMILLGTIVSVASYGFGIFRAMKK